MAATMEELGARAKSASRTLAKASTAQKNEALLTAADRLVECAPDILDANAVDVATAEAGGTSATLVDRLRREARMWPLSLNFEDDVPLAPASDGPSSRLARAAWSRRRLR